MSDYNFEDINRMYFDVLKEIGNIGAGNATTAISDMLGLRLNMEVPQVKLLSFQELGSAVSAEEDTIAGIYLELHNDLEGSMMFLLKMDSAHYLVNRLMGRAESYEEAEAICKTEPLVVEGFASYKLKALQVADKENNYLL